MAPDVAPAPRHLVRQLRDVLLDLPLLLTAPLFRRQHLTWGASPAEVRASLPGDDLVDSAQFVGTRAVTIRAAPEDVWPWLVQVGAGRAGWYSDDLLDNLGRPSADTLLPEEQHLAVGDWIPMSPFGRPTATTAFRVRDFAPGSWLLWAKPDATWAWRLTPIPGGTRLVSRVRARYDWHRPATALLGVVLMELGDFAMQRRMLIGIRVRAEAAVRGPARPPGRE